MPTYTIDGKEATLKELVSHLASQGDEAEFVPKGRLASERAARKAAEEALDAAQEAGKGASKIAKELETLRAENGELRTSAELGAAGVSDVKLQKSVRAIYAAEMDGVEKPPSLGEWVRGDGAKHPLVKHALTPPAAGEGKGKEGAGKRVTTEGASPGTTAAGSPMTPGQVAAYFASPAFRGLPRAQQQAKMAEMRAQVKGEPAPVVGGAGGGDGAAGSGKAPAAP